HSEAQVGQKGVHAAVVSASLVPRGRGKRRLTARLVRGRPHGPGCRMVTGAGRVFAFGIAVSGSATVFVVCSARIWGRALSFSHLRTSRNQRPSGSSS